MKILHRIGLNERVKWYLGRSHNDWESMRVVWAPIPLNFFIRWAVTFKNKWDIWRGRTGSFDMTLQNAIRSIVETEHRAFEMKLAQNKKDAFEMGIAYVLGKIKEQDEELAQMIRNDILMDLSIANNDEPGNR